MDDNSHVVSVSKSHLRRTASRGENWPKFIKVGSATVKIYRTVRDGRSPLYCVTYHVGRRRIRKNFADPNAAVGAAQKTANALANGQRELVTVTPDQWRLFELALSALAPLQTPIDVACREYAEARAIIGGSSVVDAARHFSEAQHQRATAKWVPPLVIEFLQAKKSSGVGTRALADYRSRLGRFANAFQCPISDITTVQLQQFLDSLAVSLRTKRNFKTAIVTLFRHAQSRGFLSRDRKSEAEHLDHVFVQPTDVEIFSPSAFGRLIRAAQESYPPLVPYLAIRAFTGIRDAEIARLDWANIKQEQRQIEVPAAAAKRSRSRVGLLRRLVPISANLQSWLDLCRDQQGPVCCYQNSQRIARRLARDIGVRWVHNGLRHAYGSCRVAETKNYPLVAYEMGNSVEIIKRHYDQVVTEADAARWFSIVPLPVAEVPENTPISLPASVGLPAAGKSKRGKVASTPA